MWVCTASSSRKLSATGNSKVGFLHHGRRDHFGGRRLSFDGEGRAARKVSAGHDGGMRVLVTASARGDGQDDLGPSHLRPGQGVAMGGGPERRGIPWDDRQSLRSWRQGRHGSRAADEIETLSSSSIFIDSFTNHSKICVRKIFFHDLLQIGGTFANLRGPSTSQRTLDVLHIVVHKKYLLW